MLFHFKMGIGPWYEYNRRNVDNDLQNMLYTIKDNYIIWLQYKIIHRILGVKKYLLTLGISDTSLCCFCNSCEETLVHLFYDCIETKKLWANVKTWLRIKLNFNLAFTRDMVILGYIYPGEGNVPFNTILLISKSYIFWCSRHRRLPNIFDLQKRIETSYFEQKYIATKNNSINKFNKIWENWTILFNDVQDQ